MIIEALFQNIPIIICIFSSTKYFLTRTSILFTLYEELPDHFIAGLDRFLKLM